MLADRQSRIGGILKKTLCAGQLKREKVSAQSAR
jgi:hypothetical protein